MRGNVYRVFCLHLLVSEYTNMQYMSKMKSHSIYKGTVLKQNLITHFCTSKRGDITKF